MGVCRFATEPTRPACNTWLDPPLVKTCLSRLCLPLRVLCPNRTHPPPSPTLVAGRTKVLVDVVRAHGQRVHVGKVSMDRNAPDYYRESTKQVDYSNSAASFACQIRSRCEEGVEEEEDDEKRDNRQRLIRSGKQPWA